MYNVWDAGRKLNAHPLNAAQAAKMVQLFNFNYGGNGKAIKQHEKI